MTQKEYNNQIEKLQNKINKLSKKEKPLFNSRYFTTSKIILHSIQILSILVVSFIMYMCKYLKSEPMYLASVLSVIATNIFVAFNMVNKYYVDKSNKDNENKNKKEKYEMSMKMAEKITTLVENKQLTPEAISLFKMLISETETNVSMNGYGGLSTVDTTKFGAVLNPVESDTEGVG